MQQYAHILQSVAASVGLEPIKKIAAKPGVTAVHRVTMHYPDYHAADAITTIISSRVGDLRRDVVYRGCFSHKPITKPFTRQDYDQFCNVFSDVRFDRLTDQEDIPFYRIDLCMVERAAGSFTHSVIFSPQHTHEPYASLFRAIEYFLPETVRELRP